MEIVLAVLPVGHLASRSATFAVPPQEVWDVINDPAFMRTRGVGDVKTETVESVPPRRLVRRIVGESSFGGTWTYIVGHHRTIDSYLAALRRLCQPNDMFYRECRLRLDGDGEIGPNYRKANGIRLRRDRVPVCDERGKWR